ncbi:MacB family efflux pump subunit [Pasteurella oralis]|uniref:MacB family efflux pump subunit n=1 Tax=Pasteurella oralis TaxID=1071947 RepID=UPI000C7BBE09|nr:MacB family efflux pump subunit [Pasteurella oralis]
MTQPLIELKNIERSYRSGNTKTTVLKSINLKVYSGEMIAIVGASGSGKSTLMNILGALDVPDNGEYFIHGKNIATLSIDELAELRCSHFGFVFQRYHLLTHLSAIKNVEIPAIYSMVDKTQRYIRAKNLLCKLGLEKQLEQKPNQLSGGQQQRVSIARALMNGGEIILADEPTGALDSKSSQEVLDILIELNQRGHTVILITHDMNIAQHASRIINIKDGEIISDTKSNLLKCNTKNIASFSTKEATTVYHNLLYSYTESFMMAFNTMLSHKVRTFLTMLGIIIGIVAVVSVIALGEGTKNKVLSEFNSLGTNTIDIYPGKWGDEDADKVQTLNVTDLALLQQQPYLKGVTPVFFHSTKLRFLNKTIKTTVYGVDQDFFTLKNYKLVSGRFFDSTDVQEMHPVGMIDRKSQKLIFGDEEITNNTIFIDDIPISIIGVIETPSLQNEEKGAVIWLPYSSVMTRMINQPYFQQITVQLKENLSPAIVDQAITDLLIAKHGQKDFFTFSSSKFLQSLNNVTKILTLMISSIAFISLVVGGIGIMNIMLVSVIERTKEIGIRVAIGAKEKDIRSQFLIESTMMSLIGGIIGILLSLLLGGLLSLANTEIQMQFTLSSFMIAFLCSSLIGIIFGYFPAKNAARLKPVDALSRE